MKTTTDVTAELEAALEQLGEARRAVENALAPLRKMVREQDMETYLNLHERTGVDLAADHFRQRHVSRLELMLNDATRHGSDVINQARSFYDSLAFEARELERALDKDA